MSHHANETRGLLLGTLGVAIFALTLPMTRLAVGPSDAPQLPPLFVTAGRAAGAGLLSVLYLWFTHARRPARADLWPLLISALGTVVGFPLFLSLALREVPAMHASVVTGVLPLFTAAVAAWHLRQRPSPAFWGCAVLGCVLVLAFAVVEGGGHFSGADGLLLLAMLCASIGYVAGAQLSGRMPAEHVISWVLVLSLPLTAPVAAAVWLHDVGAAAGDVSGGVPIRAAAWGGFAYVTVFSMWLGFFAWYRGLALGGTVRVSQVQMIQPFLALLLAAPVLGEPLRASTVLFAVGVLAVVFTGRRLSVGRPAVVPVQTPKPTPTLAPMPTATATVPHPTGPTTPSR